MRTEVNIGIVLTLLCKSILSTNTGPGPDFRDEIQTYNFDKPCHTLSDCVFRLDHLSTYNEVYLECSPNGYCSCAPLRQIADVAVWNLIWDTASQLCTIGEYGPCGDKDELQIECQAGLLCMESRCRNPRKLNSIQEHMFCFGDIDCAKHLKCIPTGFEYQEIKTCESVSVSTQEGHQIFLEQDADSAEEFPEPGVHEVKPTVFQNTSVTYVTSKPVYTQTNVHITKTYQIQPEWPHASSGPASRGEASSTGTATNKRSFVKDSHGRGQPPSHTPRTSEPEELVLTGRNSKDGSEPAEAQVQGTLSTTTATRERDFDPVRKDSSFRAASDHTDPDSDSEWRNQPTSYRTTTILTSRRNSTPNMVSSAFLMLAAMFFHA